MARLPDVVVKSFEFTGSGAREVARFLGLDDPSHMIDRLSFIQPSDYERKASASFWDKRRRPDGSMVDGNIEIPLHNTFRWDRYNQGLYIIGLWLDHNTGTHTVDRLRYQFDIERPAESGSAVSTEAVGWDRLIHRLVSGEPGNGRRSLRKSFRVRPLPSAEAGWWDRTRSRLPWVSETIEFRVDLNDDGRAEYASISVGP
jgi:hypothetical protein